MRNSTFAANAAHHLYPHQDPTTRWPAYTPAQPSEVREQAPAEKIGV